MSDLSALDMHSSHYSVGQQIKDVPKIGWKVRLFKFYNLDMVKDLRGSVCVAADIRLSRLIAHMGHIRCDKNERKKWAIRFGKSPRFSYRDEVAAQIVAARRAQFSD